MAPPGVENFNSISRKILPKRFRLVEECLFKHVYLAVEKFYSAIRVLTSNFRPRQVPFGGGKESSSSFAILLVDCAVGVGSIHFVGILTRKITR